MTFFEQVGRLALGSRIRFLGDKITEQAAQIYGLYGVDLQPKWFPVFFVLSRSTSQPITSIAKDIGHSHASVSKIVTEMKKAKLVVEQKGPDKRQTVVALSALGHKIAGKLEAQYLDVQSAIDELSSQCQHDLWKAMEEWEVLLNQKSLFSRVVEHKRQRELADIHIVPYSQEHHAVFKQLNQDWIEAYFKMEQPDHDALDHPQEYILNRGGHIFVAIWNDQPVGVCALIKRADRRYPWELAKMAVAKQARGKNIGFLLGQAVIKKAQELGAKKLFLESNTVLKPAIGLYHKLGFKKVIGPRTPYDRCNIQMEKALPLGVDR